METIIPFDRIERTDLPHVGGKGVNLGVLTQAGLPVPPGFCLTTTLFAQFIQSSRRMPDYFAQLSALPENDLPAVRAIGQELRATLAAVPFPPEAEAAVAAAWRQSGRDQYYAVRSSATAEDLPTASFAGQQDTFLHLRGLPALLTAIKRCWISLFTDRALLYRMEHGFAHDRVALAVVVQQMVQPQVSGTLFTADPVSGHRGRMVIDAGFGLGEALVSGLVIPDYFSVEKETLTILEMRIAEKKIAIWPQAAGGTRKEQLPEKQQRARTLLDHQVRDLARLARQVEALYGTPQDIEWALVDGRFTLLQTRPITTLFPLPSPNPFLSRRICLSLGHAQVMTDPISPAGISLWRAMFPFGQSAGEGTENGYVQQAGGRIYIDISPLVYTRLGKKLLGRVLPVADALIADGLNTLFAQARYSADAAAVPDKATIRTALGWLLPLFAQSQARLWRLPPADARPSLEAKIAAIWRPVEGVQEEKEPLSRLHENYQQLHPFFIQVIRNCAPYIMTAMMAKLLLDRLLDGRADPADLAAIEAGLSGNVTTEMDLALGDLADLAREQPAVSRLLRRATPRQIREALPNLPGAEQFIVGLETFLGKYGQRGQGEIDIGRPRWIDEPAALLLMIRGNLAGGAAGSHRRHFAAQQTAADAAAGRLIAAAGGGLRRRMVQRLIAVFRTHMPLREHPKFLIVRFLQLVRLNIQELGRMWEETGQLATAEDIWYLTLPEMLMGGAGSREVVAARKADYDHFSRLTPPRLLTSDGEVLRGRHQRTDLPSGAMAGTAVSPGVVRGRARVVHDPAVQTLEKGEILVAPHTDPAWTPLFINAAAVVLEVGGLMTHGSVVAREYGIPAVVSVIEATRRIQTGQWLLVDGDRGWVQILED